MNQNWEQLVKLARQAPPTTEAPVEMPLGFAGRVWARRKTEGTSSAGAWEFIALRVSVAAVALMVGALAFNAPDNEDLLALEVVMPESFVENLVLP